MCHSLHIAQHMWDSKSAYQESFRKPCDKADKSYRTQYRACDTYLPSGLETAQSYAESTQTSYLQQAYTIGVHQLRTATLLYELRHIHPAMFWVMPQFSLSQKIFRGLASMFTGKHVYRHSLVPDAQQYAVVRHGVA